MKICAISDVHEQWHNLVIPECDVLVSAGDYSYRGHMEVVQEFHEWLNKQPAQHIISVQGNHEVNVERDFERALYIASVACPRVNFIANGRVEIDGVKFYGSSITPYYNNWAWNIYRGEPIAEYWKAIPDDTNVLVTHGPAYGILDVSPLGIARETNYEHYGCEELLKRVKQLHHLKLHIFGHIHGSSGETDVEGVHFINAAICDERYKPTNPLRIYEYTNT